MSFYVYSRGMHPPPQFVTGTCAFTSCLHLYISYPFRISRRSPLHVHASSRKISSGLNVLLYLRRILFSSLYRSRTSYVIQSHLSRTIIRGQSRHSLDEFKRSTIVSWIAISSNPNLPNLHDTQGTLSFPSSEKRTAEVDERHNRNYP